MSIILLLSECVLIISAIITAYSHVIHRKVRRDVLNLMSRMGLI